MPHHFICEHPHLVSEKPQSFQIQRNFVPAIEKKIQFQAKIKTMINIFGNYLCVEKGSSSDCRSHISGGHHQNSCSLLAELPLMHSSHFFNESNFCWHWPRDAGGLPTNARGSSPASCPTTASVAADARLRLGTPGRTGWKYFICLPLGHSQGARGQKGSWWLFTFMMPNW